jgi:hypothetical protein
MGSIVSSRGYPLLGKEEDAMGETKPVPGEAVLVFKNFKWEGATAAHRVVLTEQAIQRETALYLQKHPEQAGMLGQVPAELRTIAYWVANYDPAQGDVHVWPQRNPGGYDDLPR